MRGDGTQRGQFGLGRRLLLGEIFVGDVIAELVGVAQVATEQAGDRVAAELSSSLCLNSLNSRSWGVSATAASSRWGLRGLGEGRLRNSEGGNSDGESSARVIVRP